LEHYNRGKIMLACLFPPRCPVCGGLRIPWESSTCLDCATRLQNIKEPVCLCCGREVVDDGKEYCSRCEENRMSFIRNFAVWRYDKWMKKSIADFKYNGRKEYVGFYVRHMAGRFGKQLLRYGVTALVPVPVSAKRKRYRGFNQAELLAEGLGEALGISVVKLVKRVRNTAPQNGLSPGERKKNLSAALVWDDREAIKLDMLPEKVALIDDIFTTGATMEACTKVLQDHGVQSVYGVCLCIGSE